MESDTTERGKLYHYQSQFSMLKISDGILNILYIINTYKTCNAFTYMSDIEGEASQNGWLEMLMDKVNIQQFVLTE